MVRLAVLAITGAIVLGGGGRARGGGGGDDDALVLPCGEVAVELRAEISLTARALGAPVSLAPDVWVGLDDRWTVGVFHSHAAVGLVGAGDGVCVRSGEARGLPGCVERYRGLGVGARRMLAEGRGLAAAAVVRLQIAAFDPFKLRGHLGAALRWRRGRVAVSAEPYVSIGLSHVDEGNAHYVDVPLWVRVRVGGRTTLGLRSGVKGSLESFSEDALIPIGLAADVALPRRWEVGAELTFPKLLGPRNSFFERDLTLLVRRRL